jgi:hypothetical protein
MLVPPVSGTSSVGPRMNASLWPSGCLENTPEFKYLGATIRK